jgi:hypothetical protein
MEVDPPGSYLYRIQVGWSNRWIRTVLKELFLDTTCEELKVKGGSLNDNCFMNRSSGTEIVQVTS